MPSSAFSHFRHIPKRHFWTALGTRSLKLSSLSGPRGLNAMLNTTLSYDRFQVVAAGSKSFLPDTVLNFHRKLPIIISLVLQDVPEPLRFPTANIKPVIVQASAFGRSIKLRMALSKLCVTEYLVPLLPLFTSAEPQYLWAPLGLVMRKPHFQSWMEFDPSLL